MLVVSVGRMANGEWRMANGSSPLFAIRHSLFALALILMLAGCSKPIVLERTVRDTVVTVAPQYIDRVLPITVETPDTLVAAHERDTVYVYRTRKIVRAKVYRDTIYVPVRTVETVERLVPMPPPTVPLWQRWWVGWALLILLVAVLLWRRIRHA